MYKIQTLNKIAAKGLELLDREEYEFASEIPNPDAILVRSLKMHDMELGENLKAIARAGAGTNNIPIDKCSDKGIIVFNTPGANANSVKELVITGLMISSRKVYQGISWVQSIKEKGSEVPKLVEKGKSNFAGPEIKGKKLGIVGLGAIGVMVANDAVALGMEVAGYDPFISIEAAWGLSRSVHRAVSLDALLADSDYISLHVPLNDKTKGIINAERFESMKNNVRILNFARGGLVNNRALLEAIEAGKVGAYVTDFPDEELLGNDKIIPLPHLGASTPEAEENCAVMAVQQVKDYLHFGNLTNSVNFPNCSMPMVSPTRLIVANRNVPNMVGQITTVLAGTDINITDMINKSKGDLAYNIIDVDTDVTEGDIEKLKQIEGIIMTRVIRR